MTTSVGSLALRAFIDAMSSINRDSELPANLRRIVEAARLMTDARYGAIGLLEPCRSQIAELVWSGVPPRHPPMRSFLGMPIAARDEVLGSIYLTDKQRADCFTDFDEDVTRALAGAAGMLIDNARLHDRRRELVLVEDRERIAKELHGTVIRQLFATGLSLQATSQLRERPEVKVRLQEAVEDIDTTVKYIRSAIFDLETNSTRHQGFRRRTLMLVQELSRALGFVPEVAFHGPVDTMVCGVIASELLATIREALSNVARHAGATAATLEIQAGSEIALRITDNGRGLPADPSPGSGLRNMASRAEALGGRFAARRADGGGTVVEWAVPSIGY